MHKESLSTHWNTNQRRIEREVIVSAEEKRLLLDAMRSVRYLFAWLINQQTIWRNTCTTELELGTAQAKLNEAQNRCKPVQKLIQHLEREV